MSSGNEAYCPSWRENTAFSYTEPITDKHKTDTIITAKEFNGYPPGRAQSNLYKELFGIKYNAIGGQRFGGEHISAKFKLRKSLYNNGLLGTINNTNNVCRSEWQGYVPGLYVAGYRASRKNFYTTSRCR